MDGKDADFASIVRGAKGVANEEETYLKSLVKAGPDFRESQALFVKSIDLDKRQITCLASTGDVDRDNEIIEPKAYQELLPVYMKNPVVITSHQHRLQTGNSSVIGNAVKAWIDKQGLWVVIEFVKGTALGEEYWLLYSQKKQRALSVGFIPIESEYEERNGKRVLVHTRVELLEISCVPVGSNREALSRSKQRKARFVTEKKYLADYMAEVRRNNPNFDQDCEEFARIISDVDTDFEILGDVVEADYAELVRR